ncbi:threonine aldolase family protein [Aminobacter sp. AP02]|uniref:threonine aldolase family protein n=1 Tax=Aminobacter sp. AP02 TaxID=2135737 RepID=UPI000D6B7C8C|nr:threonine aldolase family protein [Aminobacter sp. AP02]PWK60355.1 L-threonine aldolase [Aminobacter sp. AP02]
MSAPNFIDLYSDTRTQPTEDMKHFMMSAKVGDEQKDEDPTTRLLCDRVADLLGKEAAVFLPSGTMCNEIALAIHCRPGDEVLCDRSSHIINFEAGGPAALAGAMVRAIDGKRGIFSAADLAEAIRPESRTAPRTRLVSIEQTANLGGGAVWPLATIREVMAVARKSQLAGHLDGARLLNAVVASGVSARAYAEPFDSAWIDLTKGLGGPVGAVLTGSKDFIHEAWRLKQRWGGAMRQSGILAAAGVYALDHHVDRLADDHLNAQLLARGLARLPGISISPENVETNIVFFDIDVAGLSAPDFVVAMKERGVVLWASGTKTVRAVTHLHITSGHIEAAVAVVEDVLRKKESVQSPAN